MKILIVEDEPSTLNVLGTLLKTEGYEVTPVGRSDEAMELIESRHFDLMLSDIQMAPINGLELLRRAHARRPDMAVIMLTGFGSVETAVASLKLGAFDYITKPFKVDELFVTVQKALEAGATRAAGTVESLEDSYLLNGIVAVSASMRKVCEMLKRIAPADVTILLLGEDGSGKAALARAMHDLSERHKASYSRIDCATSDETELVRALFGNSIEKAGSQPGALTGGGQGGTVFIENAHALPLAAQGLLLEHLSSGSTGGAGAKTPGLPDARLLASSNAHPDVLAEKGTMLKALADRLKALTFEIPPLRERPEDIIPLALHFIRQSTRKDSRPPNLTSEARLFLEQYHWPGNVRELKDTITAANNAGGPTIGKENLPQNLVTAIRAPTTANAARKTSAAEAYRAKALKEFLREQARGALAKQPSKP